MSESIIGLIGLAVMGQNLALNISDHTHTISVYNRSSEKTKTFMKGPAKNKSIIGTYSIEEFMRTLKRPRKVILMVKAGEVVDHFIEQCTKHMEAGDILIDGGNSLYLDSNRRFQELKKKGILFVGAGISGGEEGARNGPSIMPGGNENAWSYIKPIFQSIAAKAPDGTPCCEWIGDEGAGHYVKMVHNGIEYGDMQLICEAYNLMSQALGMNADAMHQTFHEWNEGELNSYLIEITAKIFAEKDDDGSPIIDKILDVAGQKGTGKWIGINALELGSPLTLIAESVFSRCLSALKDERSAASQVLKGPEATFNGNRQTFIEYIRQALYASKIISYAQGFALMQEAAKTFSWQLNLGKLAHIWQGGCIIRSRFLSKITNAYDNNTQIQNLLLDNFFRHEVHACQKAWREVVKLAVEMGIPSPCFSAALAYYDGYRNIRLPANLLQAQRDFFGAHTYERLDKPRGEFFHTDWLRSEMGVSSSTYTL